MRAYVHRRGDASDGCAQWIVFETLVHWGGKARRDEVFPEIERRYGSRLNAADWEVLPRGEVRWKTNIDFGREELVHERNLLKADSERGVWELNSRGHEIARELELLPSGTTTPEPESLAGSNPWTKRHGYIKRPGWMNPHGPAAFVRRVRNGRYEGIIHQEGITWVVKEGRSFRVVQEWLKRHGYKTAKTPRMVS